MKHPYYLLLPLLTLASCAQQQPDKPKYVFYFISDGTGVNTVLGTEQFLAETQGRWGREALCMTSFPVVGVASTYSHNSGITDSAASGTALASGTKTYNGAIGMDADTVPVIGIAEWAHQCGVPVGIGSSVNINHATPGAQYAHAVSRQLYYDIACQLPTTQYEFFGGSDFHFDMAHSQPQYRDSVYSYCTNSGYAIARSYDEYLQLADEGAERMILFQSAQRTATDDYALPYGIDDPQHHHLSIVDVVRAQIDFLYRRSQACGDKGFFLMNEIGGKVDMACHANDAATAFREVILADSCVRLAYDFYLQHPHETLIVLTADHETGGLTLGCQSGGYVANFGLLQYQTCSIDAITTHLRQLRTETHNHVVWPQIQQVLMQDLGFWQDVEITPAEEADIRSLFTRSFVGQMPTVDNLYTANEPLADHCVRLMNAKAHIGWTTGGHTAGLVPVYACGAGAEAFSGHNDNASIAPTIARLAGWITDK